VDHARLSPEELFRACAQTGEAAAWEEFVHRFHRLIATVALRTARAWGGATPELVEELVQETYLKLCAQDGWLLRQFDSRHEGAAFGYLKVVTQNLVKDHLRSVCAEKRGGGLPSSPLDAQEGAAGQRPARGDDAGTAERQVLIGEIDVHLRAVVEGPNAARDRRIFWLHYRTGLTTNAIAGLPGIGLTTKGVESTLRRITLELRQRVATRDSPGAAPTDLAKGIQPLESF
jgi:RNA polymerase sigma-70 factor (ECF subfamily)